MFYFGCFCSIFFNQHVLKCPKKRELLLYLAIQLIRNTPGTFLMLSKTLTARFLSLAKNFSADKTLLFVFKT